MNNHSLFPPLAGVGLRHFFRTIAGVSLVALLSACASMSEKECLTANWTDQGYRDGRDGYPLSRLQDHREACSAVRVVPDSQQYQAGREVGIREYCSPANAVREGRLGRSYRNSCPMELDRSFRHYHELGYQVYSVEQRLDSLNNEMRRKQRELEKEKDDAKRNALRRELRRLDDRLAQARRDLDHEERRLRQMTPIYGLR